MHSSQDNKGKNDTDSDLQYEQNLNEKVIAFLLRSPKAF